MLCSRSLYTKCDTSSVTQQCYVMRFGGRMERGVRELLIMSSKRTKSQAKLEQEVPNKKRKHSKPQPSDDAKKIKGKADKIKAKEDKAKPGKKASSASPESKETSNVEIKRDKQGKLIFSDYPDFKPNLTPKEVLQAGSFGGTYFRPISSGVTGEHYSGVWKEFPSDWFQGLNIGTQVASSKYNADVNTYKVKCGGSLEMWESSGWIHKQDPYGWFHWYCRFYLGRRTADDERQVSRWMKCAGVKGRWKNNLITKIVNSGCGYDNPAISPVVRQTLQHWAYRLTKKDFEKQAKKVKSKNT